jgi:hypothetical protein
MFRLKYDDGYLTAGDVYSLTENTFSGRYPVGNNGFWHSGIHVRSRKVYPMLEGWLVAYRISEDYKRIPRPEELSTDQFNSLDESLKNLYEVVNQTPRYRLITPCQSPDELYSNSFFLIKHQIRLPVPSNSSLQRHDILEFFTLYTNIKHAPKRNNNYQPLGEMLNETEIAFYEEYKFRVVSTPRDERSYTTQGDREILDKSLCYFEFSDSQFHKCTFFKHNGIEFNTEILIDKNQIEQIHAPEYKTTAANIPFYTYVDTMPSGDEEWEKNLEGYLNNSTYIRGAGFAYTENNNFLKVIVKDTNVSRYAPGKPKINGSAAFIVPSANLAIDTTGMGYFELNASSPTYKKNGITIYDYNNTNGNVLGILTGGTEFELEDPQEFWRQYKQPGNNFFAALKRTNDTERKRYLHFKKRPPAEGQDIEVLISRRAGYDYDRTVICGGSPPGGYELMDHDTLLGKSVEQAAEHKEHYDLVLFFDKDKANFFNTQALDGYRIPAGARLYTKRIYENNAIRFLEDSDGAEKMIVLAKETAIETETGSGREYRGFFYKGNRKYMYEADISGCIDKILNWDENFINIGNANNNNSGLMGEIHKLVKEYFRTRNKTVSELEREWNFSGIYNEPPIVKQLKRKLVCRHPLEWDRELYTGNGPAPIWLRINRRDRRFMEKVEATDIWSWLRGGRIDGLNLSANDFIFAHPVYFADYLDREGLLTDQRIRKLKAVQDETVALPCLQPGGGRGMYGIGVNESTYCNHAAYITIRAVDEYYRLFIGNPNLYTGNHPPWDISALTADFKNILTTKGFLNRQNYIFKESNIWCDILAEQAVRGILVELPERQAQDYANMGYVVIGAWKNRPGNFPPHYATVRPGFKFGTLLEMILVNVGETNGIKDVNDGFGRTRMPEIRWYYNPNQKFQGQINWVISDHLKLR